MALPRIRTLFISSSFGGQAPQVRHLKIIDNDTIIFHIYGLRNNKVHLKQTIE